MTPRRNPDTEAAVQYLTWALEEIEKSGHPKVASHVRLALAELRGVDLRSADKPDEKAAMYAGEAERFRDKADETEQLVGLAETPSRREALTKIAESYRLTAEHMEHLSKTYRNE